MRVGRAAVYEAPNTPFVIKEYPVRPARAGEVLVRVTMSTICRSDIHSYEGRRPNSVPGILGHEIIGVIEEIGAGVDRDLRGDGLRVGDRVTWTEYYHPRHLIQALDFVMVNRARFPFRDIVDSRFSLGELGVAFKRASERSVLRAAIVP